MMLLAKTWTKQNPAGYWMSEKLDGIRALWTGRQFVSRNGRLLYAPDFFTAALPAIALDGELWRGRGMFERSAGIAMTKSKQAAAEWRDMKFIAFDAPQAGGTFEQRLAVVQSSLRQADFATAHPHTLCRNAEHLTTELARVESLGGEGIMLRKPGSAYEPRRSATLLKVKSFEDAEARVIGINQGSVTIETLDGTIFAVATNGRSIAVGAEITFRYRGLTCNGNPRNATFLRENIA